MHVCIFLCLSTPTLLKFMLEIKSSQLQCEHPVDYILNPQVMYVRKLYSEAYTLCQMSIQLFCAHMFAAVVTDITIHVQ